jgi:hypothetical protein
MSLDSRQILEACVVASYEHTFRPKVMAFQWRYVVGGSILGCWFGDGDWWSRKMKPGS